MYMSIDYLKKQAERYPLIILVIPPLKGIMSLVYTRMCHLKPGLFPEGTWDGVGRVNPTVCVDHILVYK